jgi:hypothetical protein
MKAVQVVALCLLMILLAAEGVALAVWPSRVKTILGGSPDITLRVMGALEIIIAALICALLW